MRPLRPRLGVGIGQRHISVVLVVRGAVRWAASQERNGEPLGETLFALLARRPRAGVVVPRVIVAVGPHEARVKHLTGLPALDDPRAMAAVVRGQTGRFFVGAGVPHLFSGVRIDAPGCAWIAAYRESVIDEIVNACRKAGLRVHRIVPAAVALRAAVADDAVVWRDGDIRLELAYAGPVLQRVRRTPDAGGEIPIPRLATPLVGSTAGHGGLLDAAGAACLDDAGVLGLRGGDVTRRTLQRRRHRPVVPAIACGVAAMLAAASPGMASWYVTHRQAAHRRDVEKVVQTAERDGQALAATSNVLSAFGTFVSAHGSMAVLLAQLTRALPEQAAVVALQVDSMDVGNVVAVAPHAAAVMDALERVPVLASPVIVGPVTQEADGGRTMERVTVRFHLIALGMGESP